MLTEQVAALQGVLKHVKPDETYELSKEDLELIYE